MADSAGNGTHGGAPAGRPSPGRAGATRQPVTVSLCARIQGIDWHATHPHFKHMRVARARELLLSTAAPVAHIAAAVGYDSTQALTRAFRQQLGCTPAQFRR